MYTSAQALNEVLAAISSKTRPNKSFRTVLAKYLGLEGEDGEIQAVVHLHKLVSRVRDDIEVAEIDQKTKQELNNYLSAFNGILSLSQISQNLEKSKQGILKPENIVNLTIIHIALDGKLNRYDDGFSASELSADLDQIRQDIADSVLPVALKKALDKRLSQLKSAVDHFKFYGIDGLQEALSILAGDIILRSTKQQREENPNVFKSVGEVMQKILRFINIASKAAADSRILVEEGAQVVEALENLGNVQ